ncbi:NAD-dependent epimerase/dehydratase family protein [Chitinophaga sp. Ak27]|nr:NAD-dependent epimerase/dehydratase family protein [Chitinophaga sp. Ak27]
MIMKVIITGATGMVGEGVLLECLSHPDITQILLVSRKTYGLQHPKLQECLIPDFMQLEDHVTQITGYDACFYCAGISSNGMNEVAYTFITYDVTLHFARRLAAIQPNMIFEYVSGSHTDSSEQGRIMWARVKGKTENALAKLSFKEIYYIRPGFMQPTPGQKNIKRYYRMIGHLYPLLRWLFPNQVSTMREVGLAMILAALKGYPRPILEVKDIKLLARG